MINLLKETIECLQENCKSESDVVWVGRGHNSRYVEKYKSTWEDFKSKADFQYGSGSDEIPMDLIIVGKDFWLERHEYNGSEWWEFKTMPEEPKETKELILREY